jgi:predicted metal-dependent peptidase
MACNPASVSAQLRRAVALPIYTVALVLHIKRLPKAEHAKAHWQTATDILINAPEGRDFLMPYRNAAGDELWKTGSHY